MSANQMPEFSEKEKEILSLVQGTLPDSVTPFADIAQKVGTDEETVLSLLNSLKEKEYIRRFGATLYHQQAGYDYNVMVAWCVEEENIEEVGAKMATRAEITHCYERQSHPEWPYNLYTMVHGKNEAECLQVVEKLQAETGVESYELLFSDVELKKTSMRYF